MALINSKWFSLQHPSFFPIFPTTLSSQSGQTIQSRPRVIIFISKSCHIQVNPRFDLIEDLDTQIIEVLYGKEQFLVINLYNQKQLGKESTNNQQFQDLTFDRLNLGTRSFNYPILLAGDFNLHHPLWNAAASTRPSEINKASSLINWIESNHATLLIDQEIINKFGGTLNRSNLTRDSIIDLAFTTPFKDIEWGNWNYLEASGSDHEVITFNATFQPHLMPTSALLTRWNLSTADWEKFEASFHGQTRNPPNPPKTPQECEDFAEWLVLAITEALKTSTKEAKVIANRSKPWWTKTLSDLRLQHHRALRKFKKTHTENSERDWKDARNNYFKAIKDAKENHFMKFLSEATGEKIFLAHKMVKGSTLSQVPILAYPSSEGPKEAHTFDEKCDAFLSTLFPTPLDHDPTPKPQKSTSLTSKAYNVDPLHWPNLTEKEVFEALFSTKDKSAPGPDGISYKVLKKAFSANSEPFLCLYNSLFKIGYHPKAWCEAIGFVLPKQGKDDYSTPKSYRIISLLNCLGKVLEKIYANRLAYLANTTDLLHPSQIGGRKQRSAIDAGLLLLDHVQKELTKSNKRVVSTLFLDIKGAFDHVSKPRLLAIIKDLGFPPNFYNWVDSFLTNRFIQLAFNTEIQQKTPINIGIPQGSPISPILFLIYVRGIVQSEAFQLSFMDDFSISIASNSDEKNCRQLASIALELFKLAGDQKVLFDPSKTELIHFCRKRKPLETPVVIPVESGSDLLITPKKVVRWLGLWFDFKLSFRTHIEKRLNLATGAMQQIQRLTSPSKGLSFKAFRQLMISCINPIADYGCQTWISSTTGQSTFQRFQQIQNQGITKALGAFRSSPSKPLELEAAVLPPNIRLERQAMLYSLRVLRFAQNHPIKQAVDVLIRDELGDSEDEDQGNNLLRLLRNPKTQLQCLISRLHQLSFNSTPEHVSNQWEQPWTPGFPANFQVIPGTTKATHELTLDQIDRNNLIKPLVGYTDGSKGSATNKGDSLQTGSSIALYRSDHLINAGCWNLGPELEVADAEVFAAYRALKQAYKVLKAEKERNQTAANLYLFIDSQAAIKRLQKSKGDLVVQKAKSFAFKITNELGSSITISWCPSHVGIPGNELCDYLAKQALKNKTSKEAYTSISFLRNQVNRKAIENWESGYTKKAKGYTAITKDNIRFNCKPYKGLEFFGSRTLLSAYIQLKTGHGYLRRYLFNIKKIPSPICPCGHEKQSTGHLLLRCKSYSKERKDLLKGLKVTDLRDPLKVLFSTKNGMKNLSTFLTRTKICSPEWWRNENGLRIDGNNNGTHTDPTSTL